MKTKTLAVHSIQKNMLATERKANELFILLATGKTLIIKAIDEIKEYLNIDIRIEESKLWKIKY